MRFGGVGNDLNSLLERNTEGAGAHLKRRRGIHQRTRSDGSKEKPDGYKTGNYAGDALGSRNREQKRGI